jgi:predicted acyltransferase
LYRHAIVRGLILVLLGMIYNGERGPLNFDWPNVRLPSVLGCIGLAYMGAAFIVLNTKVRGQLAWIAGLLLGYWAALKFIPVPQFGAGDLTAGHTLSDYLDRTLIPGQLLRGDRDPQGLLATVSAIATALAGVVTGQWLRGERLGGYAKAAWMIAAGALCLGIGRLWDLYLPINKNLWSSSFVVYCAGWSLLLLALFYLLIDVWGWKAWAFPLVVIGSNPILIYMAWKFVDFEGTTHKLFDGVLRHTEAYQPVLFRSAVALVMWALMYVLYRKQVFLRV